MKSSGKVKRESPDSTENIFQTHPLKRMLLSFNDVVNKRLDEIELRLEKVERFCATLEEKVGDLSTMVKDSASKMYINPTVSSKHDLAKGILSNGGSSVTLITLNSESDYPNGSWLGNENNPELRVRCHVSPSDLFHINTNCPTPEKMALILLDYLFDRNTQANSNISGCGKHKKQQLDPLYIYGIQCHLIYKFNIDEPAWNRIKQNIDSKCRTSFRRKQHGLVLMPKPKGSPIFARVTTEDSESSSQDAVNSFPVQPCASNLSAMMSKAEIIQTAQGAIQVVRASPEQLAQIQKMHRIQLVNGENLMTMELDEISDSSNSISNITQDLPDSNISDVEN